MARIDENGPGMDTRPPLPSRREVIDRVHGAGRRVAAVLPYHDPRPLLRAKGLL